MKGQELAEAVFARVDAMDANGLATWLTPDSTFVFGNWPPAEGPDAAERVVADFFAGIDGITHDILGVWESGETVVVRLDVTYKRKDGRSITLPCANIWRVSGNKIADYRVYMDVNPVFA